ncbi:hypothetical protein ACTHQ6_09405 [Arthrobacter sp. SAFR-179]|uniref:hypothetical protein n=1 Tax=Arthrobacter sp. SAFR-179 TaxID=3387279 RepID=UPI003F7BD008
MDQLKAAFAGKRVQYAGMNGTTDRPVGKVWRVTRYGVWVTFDDGSRQQLHPEGLRVIN